MIKILFSFYLTCIILSSVWKSQRKFKSVHYVPASWFYDEYRKRTYNYHFQWGNLRTLASTASIICSTGDDVIIIKREEVKNLNAEKINCAHDWRSNHDYAVCVNCGEKEPLNNEEEDDR